MSELLQSLLVAVSLVLILEGMLPFIAPHIWRRFLANLLLASDKSLRILGAVCMILGLLLLFGMRR
jgi:uncharacterized protein YjeT (DUF2065 family)